MKPLRRQLWRVRRPWSLYAISWRCRGIAKFPEAVLPGLYGRRLSRRARPEVKYEGESKLEGLAKLARLDRPAGTLLLLWPGCYSIALAAPLGESPDFALLGLFTVGAFVMRGAGCTVNDMWDRDFDKSVARTVTRPLASGRVTMFEAVAFLGAQLSAGLVVLLQLNWQSIALGAASVPLVLTYPLAKRYTNFPQLVLGLTFNWGALLGYCAATGGVQPDVCLPLYLACVSHTMVYDTIYAHQDSEDDKKLGLRSTALTFGERYTKPILAAFATAAIGGVGLAGYNAGLVFTPASIPFYSSVALFATHLGWQIQTADLRNAENLAERFKSNGTFGIVLLAGIAASKYLGG